MAIGYFFSFSSVVITLFWVYRGLRRGIYPALNIFFVFLVPLLLTLNYYDLLFGLVGWIKSDANPTTKETIAFVGTYLATMFVCVYLVLWLCSEALHVHQVLDLIGGGLLGLVTGILCSGVLMMFWFSMPFSRDKFPVNDTEMFYKPHETALDIATVVARSIEGNRRFRGVPFMRDLRYGLPGITTTVGSAIYVASIPNGLRVFADPGGAQPEGFLSRIKERLNKAGEELSASEERQAWGEKSRSPIAVQGGDSALVAVVMEDVPRDIVESATEGGKVNPAKMFRDDGEAYYSMEFINGRNLFIRIYQVKKEGTVGSVVALFQPCDPKFSGMVQENFLPTKACFSFSPERMKKDLLARGVTDKEADEIIRQLQFGGKALFTDVTKKPCVVEITGPDTWRIFGAADNLREGGYPGAPKPAPAAPTAPTP